MKKMLMAFVLFFAIVYIMLQNFFPNVEINKYDNIETAIKNDALKNAILPKTMPQSAYEITESHDVEKSNIFGSFSYKDEDETSFIESLTIVKDANSTYESKNFMFKIDTEKNIVQFRNKAKN